VLVGARTPISLLPIFQRQLCSYPNGRDRVGGAIDIHLAENGDLARRAWLAQISKPRVLASREIEDEARLAVVVVPDRAGHTGVSL
jgi:hypothetical protein